MSETTVPVDSEVVGGDVSELKERLRTLLLQLRTESGILDRVVHKGKNQHRRCSYFKFVLKVRRDVRLLLSGGLEEILRSLFCILDEKKPLQRFHMLEILKKAHPSRSHNYHERLLGIARLLSQMFEPIVTAAIQMSSLLARSFFMGYSLLILALLARIRVLVQQVLLDVVTVFNLVSNLSRGKHAIKLTQDGVEAFREYHPPCGEVITLACIWEGDKFVLHERTQKSKTKNQNEDVVEAIPLSIPAIQYETIEITNEGQLDAAQTSNYFDDQHLIYTDRTDIDNEKEELSTNKGSPAKSVSMKCVAENGDFSHHEKQLKVQNNSSKKVAFIQVRKSRPFEADENMVNKKLKIDQLVKDKTSETNESEDPFFRLLTTGF